MFAGALPERGRYRGHSSRKPKKSRKAVAIGVLSVVVVIAAVTGAILFQPQLVAIVGALTEEPASNTEGFGLDGAAPAQQPAQEAILATGAAPSGSARLDLVVVPGTGVDVSVDGGPYQPVPSFLDLSPGSHILEFRAEGFEPHTTSTEVSAGQQRITAVVLNPLVPGAGAGTLTVDGTESGSGPADPPAAVNTPADAPAPASQVTLQINARPWAQVFLDGAEMESLGQTPLGNVRVQAGSVLVFRNPGFPDKTHVVAAGDETIQVAFP